MIPWTLLFLLLTFYASHSILADLSIKKRLYSIVPNTHYRIAYNIISALFTVAIVIAYWYASKPLLLQVPSWLAWLGWGMVATGLWLNKMAVNNYDRSEFLGLSYLQQPPGEYVSLGGELKQTGLNAWVRHPIYSSILLMVWGWFLA
ncbi:MAG: NnrU family protein, partial [Bacteroidota bacterium]